MTLRPSPLRRFVLLVALCCASLGCRPNPEPAQPATSTAAVGSVAVAEEAPLEDQITAVQRGETTRILVEREVLGDDDLVEIAKLAPLVDLLLDNDQSQFTLPGVAPLAELPQLQHLRIRGRGIDDAALAEIAKLKRLRILNLPRGSFTDAGLAHLAELADLEMFRFGSPAVGDEGMKTIARWPAIRMLHLIDVPITDKGLAELAKIERLQSLYIDGGQITDAGWDALFRDRPRLHVHVNQQHLDRDPNRHAH